MEEKTFDPLFVTHCPKELVPLAKQNPEDDSLVDVYELIINGQEISPGYTELNDPTVQRQRLVEQVGEETQKIDGVPCRVVLDRLFLRGTLAETTRDYYTQDNQGNVWMDQGIERGWADNYTWDLPGQYIDITNVPDGFYYVGITANPQNLLVQGFTNPATGRFTVSNSLQLSSFTEIQIDNGGTAVTCVNPSPCPSR